MKSLIQILNEAFGSDLIEKMHTKGDAFTKKFIKAHHDYGHNILKMIPAKVNKVEGESVTKDIKVLKSELDKSIDVFDVMCLNGYNLMARIRVSEKAKKPYAIFDNQTKEKSAEKLFDMFDLYAIPVDIEKRLSEENDDLFVQKKEEKEEKKDELSDYQIGKEVTFIMDNPDEEKTGKYKNGDKVTAKIIHSRKNKDNSYDIDVDIPGYGEFAIHSDVVEDKKINKKEGEKSSDNKIFDLITKDKFDSKNPEKFNSYQIANNKNLDGYIVKTEYGDIKLGKELIINDGDKVGIGTVSLFIEEPMDAAIKLFISTNNDGTEFYNDIEYKKRPQKKTWKTNGMFKTLFNPEERRKTCLNYNYKDNSNEYNYCMLRVYARRTFSPTKESLAILENIKSGKRLSGELMSFDKVKNDIILPKAKELGIKIDYISNSKNQEPYFELYGVDEKYNSFGSWIVKQLNSNKISNSGCWKDNDDSTTMQIYID